MVDIEVTLNQSFSVFFIKGEISVDTINKVSGEMLKISHAIKELTRDFDEKDVFKVGNDKSINFDTMIQDAMPLSLHPTTDWRGVASLVLDKNNKIIFQGNIHHSVTRNDTKLILHKASQIDELLTRTDQSASNIINSIESIRNKLRQCNEFISKIEENQKHWKDDLDVKQRFTLTVGEELIDKHGLTYSKTTSNNTTSLVTDIKSYIENIKVLSTGLSNNSLGFVNKQHEAIKWIYRHLQVTYNGMMEM